MGRTCEHVSGGLVEHLWCDEFCVKSSVSLKHPEGIHKEVVVVTRLQHSLLGGWAVVALPWVEVELGYLGLAHHKAHIHGPLPSLIGNI